ncbi:MAG: type II secretion system protein GspD [Armatimonadetes bacterium]|nr:type II secretion system protein GspD [Armatimonadota bacterium]
MGAPQGPGGPAGAPGGPQKRTRTRSGPGPRAGAGGGKGQGQAAGKSGEQAGQKKEEEPQVTITPTEHGWTLHAVNADAHEVLTSFAREAGLKLIVDDTVKRKLTIHILDRPAAKVIDLIVDAYGLSLGEVNGVQIISEGMPKNPSSYLLSEIASVTTKYVAPAQAQKLLPVFLQGHVRVNTDGNAVVLSGPRAVLEKFRDDVHQFDVPAKQVMLDVLVVEFTDMDADSFMASLGVSNSRVGVYTDSLTGNLVLSAITRLPTDFFAHLEALVTRRKARVRANPRIATISGRPASIFIGVQQYLSTPVSLEGSRSTNSIDAGVSLNMTPLTGGGGEIILDINQEISTLSTPDPVTGLPTKTTRSSNTTVRVKDGETIVIGGLRQEEERATRRAIPILSQIPVIGNLFKSKRIEKTNVDLAIFITTRLLSQTGHLPAEMEQKLQKDFELEVPAAK